MADVLADRQDHVVVLTLNRPEKKNAINRAMWRELRAQLARVAEDPDDRVVIVTGAGDGFCAGGDVSESLTEDGTDPVESVLEHMRLVESVALSLHECPKPTIAAVNGTAAGGGLTLALGCDLTVVAENATLSQVFVRHGLIPDCGGLWLLPRLVGLHRAKELALLGESITAREAGELGLVNRVVEPGQALPVACTLARRMAGFAPEALSVVKQAMNRAFDLTMPEMLDLESSAQARLATSAGYLAARDAFLATRGRS